MDVVYICRQGPNEELRYSLRSLVNIEHDRVWVFGGAPAWFTGKHIPVPQSGVKQANAKMNLLAACLHPRVSDPFLLMNDDFYIIAPTEPALYDRGPAARVIAEYERMYPRGSYAEYLKLTDDLLRADGHTERLSYELHVPMPVGKALMRDVVMRILADGRVALNHRSMYGALVGMPSTTMRDPKVYGPGDLPPEGAYLSSSDATFPLVLPLLEELFPDPSPYEAPDMAALIRQEDGPMYVSPSRITRKGVLIAYAGEVMTEAEARRRGLEIEAPEPAPKPVAESAPEPAEPAPKPKRTRKRVTAAGK